MMREHHESALKMGPLVLQKATHEELKEQAQQMIASQQQEQAMFGGWLQGLYGLTPPTSTGDMQDGMDAVMHMTATPEAPSSAPTAPAAGSATPRELPHTGGESDLVWVAFVVSIVALLSGGYVLRRRAA